MGYTYERFGDTSLPQAAPIADLGTGAADPGLQPMAGGGAYNPHGSGRAPMGAKEVSYTGRITGAWTSLQTQLEALENLIGQQDKLWRRAADFTQRWCYAVLSEVAVSATNENMNYMDIEFVWQLPNPVWHGLHHQAPWKLDDGYYLDDGLMLDAGDQYVLDTNPKILTINNGGLYPVTSLKVTITAGSADITALGIQIPGRNVDFTFGATILAGKSLVIDTGAWTVKNDGVGAYSSLTRLAGHTARGWLELGSGDNSVTVLFTGGSTDSTITWEFDDGWA